MKTVEVIVHFQSKRYYVPEEFVEWSEDKQEKYLYSQITRLPAHIEYFEIEENLEG